MSMWVRLIGGPFNGQVHLIDIDQMELTAHARLPATIVPSHRNFGLPPASVDLKFARYTRRLIRNEGGEKIVYFALEGLSDFEALQSVLGP